MAEAASELRRHTLDCLRADRLARAEELLAVMDEVYALLVTVDYPDAVTGGLRRTTDALRAVIERTRGDLTNALVAQRLRAAIEHARGVMPGFTPRSPSSTIRTFRTGGEASTVKRISVLVLVALVATGCNFLRPRDGFGPILQVRDRARRARRARAPSTSSPPICPPAPRPRRRSASTTRRGR